MAFVNRRFTEQEKNEITERKLINFKGPHLHYIDPSVTSGGTIDEERCIYLLYLRRHREETDDYFMLLINDLVINIILIQQIQNPNTIIWSIKTMEILSETFISKEAILDLLKEALTEYRWNGFEDKRINGPANVKFNF